MKLLISHFSIKLFNQFIQWPISLPLLFLIPQLLPSLHLGLHIVLRFQPSKVSLLELLGSKMAIYYLWWNEIYRCRSRHYWCLPVESFYVWNSLLLAQMILLNQWRRVLLLLWSRGGRPLRSIWTRRPGCRLILLGSEAIGWTFSAYFVPHLRFHGIPHSQRRQVDSVFSISSIELNIHHTFLSSFHFVSRMGASLRPTAFSTSQMLWPGSDFFHYFRPVLFKMPHLFSMIS